MTREKPNTDETEYHKLVRDRIPEIIEENGEKPVTREAGDEYLELLADKLVEEAQEFGESYETEELADVLEVLYAVCDCRGIDFEELEGIREKKAEERGGFEEGIVLEKVIR